MMKKEVLVKNITPNMTRLIGEVNSEVRTMNLMIDQLYDQQVKMEEIEEQKAKYPDERARREKALNSSIKNYEDATQDKKNIEAEIKQLKLFDIKRRIELSRDLKEAEERGERLKESLLRASFILNKKNDWYSHIDTEVERVLVPNFRNHLAKFYKALRTYREKARVFESISGENLPEIDDKKIIVYGEGKLPTVNIDIEIPRIELEVYYDQDYLEQF